MSDLIERTNKRTETHACDCISRHAAIDEIRKCRFVVDAIKKIIGLPSAQPDRSLWFRIGEICVDESKGFISSGRAVEKIRELLREAERREE